MHQGYEYIQIARRQGRVDIRIERPAKHNALSRDVLNELRTVFTDEARREDIQLALLRGAGERSFAAGGDLRELDAVRSEEQARQMSLESGACLDAIRNFPVPVIAVLNGDALGGGAELALACDLRIAAAHARLGFIQGRLNVSTAWGGGVDLFQAIGPRRGLALLARSELLSPVQALALGLIDAMAPEGGLDQTVDEYIAPMLLKPPQVLRAFKALALAAAGGLSRPDLRRLETEQLVATWTHPDHWRAAANILKARPEP